MNDLALVIPFYNEELLVTKVLKDLAYAFSKSSISYTILAVDNGSQDNTGPLISELQKKNENIRLVTVTKNQGYGFGIITGLTKAKAIYIGFMDGDGQVKAADVVRLAQTLKKDPALDFAKVYREQRFDGPLRKLFSLGYNLFVFLLFGIRTKDINSCPKLWKYSLHQKIKPLYSKDWFIDTEVMAKARAHRARMKEIPIVFAKREKGKSHVKLTIIYEFLKNCIKFKIKGRL